MSKHYSYGSLLRQRIVVAALTLGLVTIMTGLFIELTVTSKKSTIDNSVQKLIEPLNPLLDLETISRLESYPIITREAIRSAIAPKDIQGVGQVVPNEDGASSSPASVQTPVASPVPLPSPETEVAPEILPEDIIPEPTP